MPWEEAALFRRNSTTMPDLRWSSSVNFNHPVYPLRMVPWAHPIVTVIGRYGLTTKPSMTCSDMLFCCSASLA